MKKLTKEEIIKILGEPNGAEKLTGMNVDPDALFDSASALFKENGSASALLIRLVNKKQYLVRLSEDKEFLSALGRELSGDNAKLRRNAARLIGAMKLTDMTDELISAISKEDQRFVRPSMLLALGSLGGEKAEGCLRSYRAAPPADDTEKKHYEEETRALTTALRSFAPKEEHVFTGLAKPMTAELRAPDLLTHVLADELADLGFASFDDRHDSLKTTVSDLSALYNARCFSEALFPIGTVTADAAAIAKKAVPFLEELMRSSHSGRPPFRFRVELKIPMKTPALRQELVREISDRCESASLVNAPSDYEVELRVEGSEKNARLYAKLFTFRDERFSYRAESIPASMSPYVAAAVLRFASDYLSVNARVLDPCCGSGTFLIERGLMSPCASLTGVDIAHNAIDVARRNTALSGVNAKYTVNDILRFECHRPYDELIANLPFGNRVGSHSSCEKLYAGLLAKLPQLVKKGGVAILYTMEFTLLKRLIREQGERLTLLSQQRTEAGGLTPMIFILRIE
ncbi:MAG: methyltransferase domain-containing protein [Clostridia bacterium]|nr:methyltransferase domain-containing protein [Clostridia bacterium]